MDMLKVETEAAEQIRRHTERSYPPGSHRCARQCGQRGAAGHALEALQRHPSSVLRAMCFADWRRRPLKLMRRRTSHAPAS